MVSSLRNPMGTLIPLDAIKSERSTIHILIGAKKFMEGWSSYRVSTMGLLNVGKTEGSQIIQLFGRGVGLEERK